MNNVFLGTKKRLLFYEIQNVKGFGTLTCVRTKLTTI